jgi:membrane protease YdiL (CAAX protease family)
LAAGTVFALLHMPNFSLMLATLFAGSVWAWQGYRHRALLPLIATHALLGWLLVLATPAWLLRSAEIGGRFLMPP